jgi:hypothetical protein
MQGIRKPAYVALLLFGLLPLVQAVAQAPVRLSPIRQIRKGVDEWPLIANPSNDAERRINKHLGDLNAGLSHTLKECHSNYVELMRKQKLPTDENGEGVEFWRQHTKVTMLGPALLSLVATTDFYCGGAHPYGFTSAAVFDLRTGEPADVRAWFLSSLKSSFDEDGKEDSAMEKSISVEGLVAAYQEATHHQCEDVYSDQQAFLIWPDAKSGKVMIQADRLPGCCDACGIEIGLAPEQARKLGFSETFLQAIRDAHKKLSPVK